MDPVFLFSLPRSGSTLLQRLLAGHSGIASAPEPWLLLPLASMLGDDGVEVYADYSRKLAADAVAGFAERMPGGMPQLRAFFAEAVTRSYEAAAGHEARYFLDKTPRYFLIVDFVLDLFPGARGIVLVRHPLDVLSSVIDTWGGGRLWLHHAMVDLYRGPVAIDGAVRRHGDRLLVLRYEDLVADPRGACERACAFLGIDFEESMLAGGGVEAVSGRMGDASAKRGSEVHGASVARWRTVLATPLRRAFARRYLGRLGPRVLETFGVDEAEARRELDALAVEWKHTPADAFWLAASYLGTAVAGTVLRDRWSGRRARPFTKLE